MLTKLTHEQAISLLDTCPLALLLTDASGHLHGFNTAFASLVGDTADSLTESGTDLHVHDILAPLLGQNSLINWVMPDGDARWLAVETATLAKPTGGMARFYQDVTEKLRLKQERDTCSAELQNHSLRDPVLTSLLNRRGILVSLEPLVARSRRYDTPLAVIAMRLETEQERNKALVKVSYLLKDQTRWADLVGSTEQHDFILILQETSQEDALLLVKKLSARLERISESHPAGMKACYGVTRCWKNDNAETLLDRVESALKKTYGKQGMTVISEE